MTKHDIIESLTDKGLTRASAQVAADGVIEAISGALCSGKSVFLRGLGTFKVTKTKEKKARDITRGTTITMPAGHRVKFIPSDTVKKALYHGNVD